MNPTQPRDLIEYQSDHDLLIEMRTEMRGMRADVKTLGDTTAKRQDEQAAAIKEQAADIKANAAEIASLKTTRAIAYAYAALITLILIPIVTAYIGSGRI